VNELLPVWRGLDAWRAEAASVAPLGTRLFANGNQLGVEPRPYRLVYDLRTGEDYVAEELRVKAWSEGWDREITVVRTPEGRWRIEMVERGDGAPAWHEPRPEALAGALDCDLGFSPLTNLMPVRRHRLHAGPGAADLLMAWVSVPGLTVHASPQRYEHVRAVMGGGAVVRYLDRGAHDGFTADLVLDSHGLAETYPGLAERVR